MVAQQVARTDAFFPLKRHKLDFSRNNTQLKQRYNFVKSKLERDDSYPANEDVWKMNQKQKYTLYTELSLPWTWGGSSRGLKAACGECRWQVRQLPAAFPLRWWVWDPRVLKVRAFLNCFLQLFQLSCVQEGDRGVLLAHVLCTQATVSNETVQVALYCSLFSTTLQHGDISKGENRVVGHCSCLAEAAE